MDVHQSTSPTDPSPQDSPPSSPSPEEEMVDAPVPKKMRKKRKPTPTDEHGEKIGKAKPKKRPKKDSNMGSSGADGKKDKPRKQRREQLSAQQTAVNEQMRRALEDDAYSALGSIVDTDTDDDDCEFKTRGGVIRLDRTTILTAMRKRLWVERMTESNANSSSTNAISAGSGGPVVTSIGSASTEVGAAGKKKRKKTVVVAAPPTVVARRSKDEAPKASSADVDLNDDALERDEGSIFGQTTGSSNATWVECDKCKKWRRLRGVVDEKKLPSKWYCSMNKNDIDRARCSAPEEEYETPNTPESAADARIRKHLRVWVRRLESNENYEARQPTMTRGKKRSAAPSAKEPYEWVRCCNPSCGKWRAILRCMDAKQHVMDRTIRGEWYCVMNTWDEKMASCAAPQENLPAIGCPPWVMQDE
eukprot:CAMPEP_0119015742 /NCGR_PEP_ID=MMETSP1176-20130426/11506_1 /TAXON_ID=265551 /ORGANISM="Synedropsis recta cf, Strain CCMP1620" /LENGTH=417 /DNA_ID=CAMNT_0006969057 /DNA_START=228 /DNA_END=1481 /DNA_ORIENTATION=+